MRKILSVFLAALLALSLTGGAVAEVAVNEPGQLPIVNEPITLTIGVEQSAVIEDWETNAMTKMLEEKTGINLDFVVYPSSEMGTKLELIVAAGGDDLPDVLLGNFTQNQIMPWAEAGMILPLTEYFENSCYWAKESFDTTSTMDLETALKYVTSYDGEIYGHIGWNGTWNNELSGARLNFYVPWLEKLGLGTPKTIEELYNVLVAFRDSDANGNGVKDEIPLTGYSDQVKTLRRALMDPFVYTQNDYWTVDENGTIGVAYNTDAWREGLRFVHKLFAEGLIDPAVFTQDQNALTITLSQDPHVVGAFARFSSTNMSADDPDRYQWDRQDWLEGPEGATVAINPALPGLKGLVTKNCQNPKAAFMFLDYMTGVEMSTFTRFGYAQVKDNEALRAEYLKFWQEEAGHNYPEIYFGDDTENPEYLPLNVYDFDASSWGTLQNTWWAQVGPNILSQEVNDLYTVAGNIGTEKEKMSYENEYRARHAMLESINHEDRSKVVAGLVYTEDEQEAITDYYAEITTFVESTWAAYAIGTMDIEDDATWNNYVSQLEKMNLSACIEATQSAYDRQQGK